MLIQKGIKNLRAEQLPLEKLAFNLIDNQLKFQIDGILWQCDLETYQLKQIGTVPIESLTAYLPQDAPKAMGRAGQRSILTFINRSEQEVELFWLDTSGNRISYGKVKPGRKHRQKTSVGHLWLIVGEDNEPVCVYLAAEKTARAVIGVDQPKPFSSREKGHRNQSENNKQDHTLSPDGRWQALIKDNNVGLRKSGGEEEFMLTKDGTAADGYLKQFFWSPDSKKLVVIRRIKGQTHKVYFVESAPEDQIEPKLHSIDYHKPGDKIDIDRPCLFDIDTQKQIPVDHKLFSNPYQTHSYHWQADSGEFTFVYNQRGHQALRVVGIESATGSTRAIIDETAATFICYSNKYFYESIDNTDEIIWMSERDGWNHLYLYDSKTGCVKNQITKGSWVVRNVEHVDPDNRQIWFRASGVYPDQDPYYIHYCRINFDGSGFTILTEGNGTHTAQFSPDRQFFVDTYSRVDMPPVHELRRTDNGKLVCELERANWERLLETGWRAPKPFVAKGRDGVTDIYGVIYRPTNFDPNQSYPVIENIYAGPHGNFAPKKFGSFHPPQKLAELGFVLVQIDGMGTSNRSKKFHDVCWKNLADAGFPDRIAWIKAAAQQYPYIDTSRVGIYGTSAGGQNAAGALMTHGDFYKAAIADCGCHDNRMDKIWWNEQWMGWPVGPEYKANSNVTLAKNMQGELFLIVGEMDNNVDPASTMQVVDALIKADKDFDLLVVPGGGHGAGANSYGRRRQADFFVRHLLGIEPRSRPL